MARGPGYKVPFRRRREGRTDYRQRARLLRAGVPRAVVRHSLRHTTVQFIEYDPQGDRVIAAAHSKELEKMGWDGALGNIPSAYVTGYIAGKRALEKGIDQAVLDIGLRPPARGASSFASLKGIIDAGVKVPHGEGIIPEEDRLMGKHISEEMERTIKGIIDQMEGD